MRALGQTRTEPSIERANRIEIADHDEVARAATGDLGAREHRHGAAEIHAIRIAEALREERVRTPEVRRVNMLRQGERAESAVASCALETLDGSKLERERLREQRMHMQIKARGQGGTFFPLPRYDTQVTCRLRTHDARRSSAVSMTGP